MGFDYKGEGEYFVNTNYALTEKPKDGGGDRLRLRLSREEVDLIKGLKKAGKKVVAVLFSGCAILVDEWKEYADAIVMNYYAGCEGGRALANLLFGAKNFSGHLPFTVAKKEEDYPSFKYIGDKPYEITYGYYHGYTLLDKEGKDAAYPFGYGKSYTDFALEGVEVSRDSDGVLVRATVRNTGSVDGAQVVQVYAGSNGAANGADRPVKLLKGIARVEVPAGEEKAVEIRIPMEELRFWDRGEWILDPAYTIYTGFDSRQAMDCARELELN